jgi:hypothetical protein
MYPSICLPKKQRLIFLTSPCFYVIYLVIPLVNVLYSIFTLLGCIVGSFAARCPGRAAARRGGAA